MLIDILDLQKKQTKTASKFDLDCSGPVNDQIFDLDAFVSFFILFLDCRKEKH
jgi:hypothetical protein